MEMDVTTVLAIAREAGDAIMEVYSRTDMEVAYKEDDSPLTLADRRAHDIICQRLRQHFPQIPILSEEGQPLEPQERQQWQRLWLVDPLDGTKEFLRKNGEFTVNIALVEAGSPVLGVVHVPAQERTFAGQLGQGAWVYYQQQPPQPLQVASAAGLNGLAVVQSRSHPSPKLAELLSQLPVAEDVPVGSALKFCVVAEGKAHIYPRLGPTMEWDTGAGHALLRAAGGEIYRLDGQPLRYNKADLHNPWFVAMAADMDGYWQQIKAWAAALPEEV